MSLIFLRKCVHSHRVKLVYTWFYLGWIAKTLFHWGGRLTDRNIMIQLYYRRRMIFVETMLVSPLIRILLNPNFHLWTINIIRRHGIKELKWWLNLQFRDSEISFAIQVCVFNWLIAISVYLQVWSMPECPHCNYYFISWLPLKKHLYEDSLYCKEEERKYQARIYDRQQSRRLQHPPFVGSPPVTPWNGTHKEDRLSLLWQGVCKKRGLDTTLTEWQLLLAIAARRGGGKASQMRSKKEI